MSDTFKITLAQLNPTVGDLNGNADKAFAAWKQGKHGGADLVALPEMFITGYNARFNIQTAFHMAAIETIQRLAGTRRTSLGYRGPWKGYSVFNAYFILHSGQIKSVVEKHHLPNEAFLTKCAFLTVGRLAVVFCRKHPHWKPHLRTRGTKMW